MTSFDIESLFTNAPLKETTEIIIDKYNSLTLNLVGLNKITYRKLSDVLLTIQYLLLTTP